MTSPVKYKSVVAHDPKRAVKGGQFRGGYDVQTNLRAVVRAPFDAKIPHVYKDKTRCAGPKVPAPAGSFQFSLSEEIMANGNRHLTGRRAFFARAVPLPGVGRHVKEGDEIAVVFENSLHVSGNKPGLAEEILGL